MQNVLSFVLQHPVLDRLKDLNWFVLILCHYNRGGDKVWLEASCFRVAVISAGSILLWLWPALSPLPLYRNYALHKEVFPWTAATLTLFQKGSQAVCVLFHPKLVLAFFPVASLELRQCLEAQ